MTLKLPSFLLIALLSVPIPVYAQQQDLTPNILITIVSTAETSFFDDERCTIDVAPSKQEVTVTTVEDNTTTSTRHALPRGVPQEDGSCRFRLLIQSSTGDTYTFQVADEDNYASVDGLMLRAERTVFLPYPHSSVIEDPDARGSGFQNTEREDAAVDVRVTLQFFVPASLLNEPHQECELTWKRRGPELMLWSEYFADKYPVRLVDGTPSVSNNGTLGCTYSVEVHTFQSKYYVFWIGSTRYVELEGDLFIDGATVDIDLSDYP